jgi:hypothetical protein
VKSVKSAVKKQKEKAMKTKAFNRSTQRSQRSPSLLIRALCALLFITLSACKPAPDPKSASLELRIAALESAQLTNRMEFDDMRTNSLHWLFTLHQRDESNLWDLERQVDKWTDATISNAVAIHMLNYRFTNLLSNNPSLKK